MASSTTHRSRDEHNEQEIQRCVQLALRTALPERVLQERRRERRYPFPYPVRLQPVAADGEANGEQLVVLGKHITNHGLDFYYQQSIPYRRVIARFEVGSARHVELLMTLTWCRFGRHGWYENGGRFLSAVTPEERSATAIEPIVATQLDVASAGLLLGQ